MILVRDPEFFRSAAGDTKLFHGGLHADMDGGNRHYEPSDDYQVPASRIVLQGLLPRKEGETHIAVSEVFGVGQSRCKNVRHDGRFAQDHTHFGLAPVLLSLSLQERSKHNRGAQSNHIHCNNSSCDNYVKQLTIASSDGEQTVNPATKDTPHSATVAS